MSEEKLTRLAEAFIESLGEATSEQAAKAAAMVIGSVGIDRDTWNSFYGELEPEDKDEIVMFAAEQSE